MKWLKRFRGALGTGLTWALAWAVGGLLIGLTSVLLPGFAWDRFFAVFDAPLPALGVPGFIAGLIFSIVLGVAGRHRRFDDLSVPQFAAWGALGGLLLTLFPFALVALGLASREGSTIGTWQIISLVGPPFIFLSAASAAGSLMLARRAKDRQALDSPCAGVESGQSGGLPRKLPELREVSVTDQLRGSSGGRTRPHAVTRSRTDP
ncbi:MAG TPA: hypothetical protein VHM24_09475 [Gemmatimonadaceae bacterium]|nr:hypothetical protein [Gemmatimonadaceae bacterium]